MLNGAALHGLDDLVGHAEHRIVPEADQNFLARSFSHIWAGQGFVDDGAEIEAVDVGHIGPCSAAPGKKTVFVRFGWFLDAVGVEDDGAGELGQFLGLILPGTAEVTGQMRVFFQTRIAVGWEHLAMGVDVDALAFALLEQLFQHLQVVAGNQNTLAGLGTGINRGRHRMAIVFHMTFIELAHHGQVVLAALHAQVDKIHQAELGIAGGGQGLFDKCGHFGVGLAENAGVIGIGRHTLKPVDENFYHRADIRIAVQVGNAEFLALDYQIRCRDPGWGAFFKGWCLDAIGLLEGFFAQTLSFIFKFGASNDNICKAGSVEVDIGHRCKQTLNQKRIESRIGSTELTGFTGKKSEPLQTVQ